MGAVLIAYDNDKDTILHDFFELCADEAKQICLDNSIGYSSIFPPNLNEHSVVGAMSEYQLCFIAGHGDVYGVQNEHRDYVVSVYTTNYNFSNKGFYSVACSCAQELRACLMRCGLCFFVGYNKNFIVRGDYEPFVKSAMSGLESLLSGSSIQEAKEKMLATFDRYIEFLDENNPMAAVDLLHDKETLVFEGDRTLSLSSL